MDLGSATKLTLDFFPLRETPMCGRVGIHFSLVPSQDCYKSDNEESGERLPSQNLAVLIMPICVPKVKMSKYVWPLWSCITGVDLKSFTSTGSNGDSKWRRRRNWVTLRHYTLS